MNVWKFLRMPRLYCSALSQWQLLCPAFAQTQEKKADTTKPAQPLKAKFKAQITAEQLTINKNAAKKYVPFDYKDLVLNAKQDKVPGPDTVITLHNGTKAKAKDTLTAINNLEKWLCEHGYSMRDKQASPKQATKIQALAIPKDKLKAPQAVAEGTIDKKVLATFKSPAALAKLHALLSPSLPERSAPLVICCSPSKTARLIKSFGDTSSFGAAINASLTMTGDTKSTAISGMGKASVSLFGHSTDLIVATGDLSARTPAASRAKSKLPR